MHRKTVHDGYNATEFRILSQCTIFPAVELGRIIRIERTTSPPDDARSFANSMKFHLTTGTGNTFTGYGQGYAEVNRERYKENLVVMPERIVTGWVTAGFDALTREDFRALLDWRPEIVLLGTGESIRFPHPRLTADLTDARIGVDVMDFKAACRTYNVLTAEGRRVVAALILA